jgi:hypothetical protein
LVRKPVSSPWALLESHVHTSWAGGLRRSEIRIQLREVPGDLFADQTGQGPNEFVLRMQPEEELYLKMTIKKPGLVRSRTLQADSDVVCACGQHSGSDGATGVFRNTRRRE